MSSSFTRAIWIIFSLLFEYFFLSFHGLCYLDNIRDLELIRMPKKKKPLFSMKNFTQIWWRLTVRLISAKYLYIYNAYLNIIKATLKHLTVILWRLQGNEPFFRFFYKSNNHSDWSSLLLDHGLHYGIPHFVKPIKIQGLIVGCYVFYEANIYLRLDCGMPHVLESYQDNDNYSLIMKYHVFCEAKYTWSEYDNEQWRTQEFLSGGARVVDLNNVSNFFTAFFFTINDHKKK